MNNRNRPPDHAPNCHLVQFNGNGKCNCGEDERWNHDEKVKTMTDNEREKFQELKELNLMLVKFSRRVVHDMAHMHDSLPYDKKIYPSREEWSEKIDMWKSIFYPDNGMKNYRLEMHREMSALESSIIGYQNLLKENNIEDPYKIFPFGSLENE